MATVVALAVGGPPAAGDFQTADGPLERLGGPLAAGLPFTVIGPPTACSPPTGGDPLASGDFQTAGGPLQAGWSASGRPVFAACHRSAAGM